MESTSGNLIRIDVWLVEKALAPSRSKAQELIQSGAVEWQGPKGWMPVNNASLKVSRHAPSSQCRLQSQEVLKYVSRGGRKLEAALQDFQIDVNAFKVLDLGQSTGGFTDCLLQLGVASVVGVDVGHEQLDPRLRSDERVLFFEGLHLKDLARTPAFLQAQPVGGFQLTVADLSFISSLDHLAEILPWSPQSLILVKPQFEVAHLAPGKKKLVQSEDLFSDLKVQWDTRVKNLGFRLTGWLPSRLPGKDGNQEFFAWIHK